MKKEMTVGPIQKGQPVKNKVYVKVRKQMKKMKLGEFFKVTGIDGKSLGSLRAALTYYSKRDGVRVSTVREGNSVSIQRVRK